MFNIENLSWPAMDIKLPNGQWLHRHTCAVCGYGKRALNVISNDGMERVKDGRTVELCNKSTCTMEAYLEKQKANQPVCDF